MFGLGKKKVHLGEASRLITTSLLALPAQDYSDIQEVRANFSDDDISIINFELELFR